MLRTRLPIRIGFTMAVRHHSDDDRQLQQQAEC
jgi:hypothetical protein